MNASKQNCGIHDGFFHMRQCSDCFGVHSFREKAFSGVINGMIYGFNFILPLLENFLFVSYDDEGVNVINVACVRGG